MSTYTWWFSLAFIFVAVEMFTGTFYFLVLAIACAVGGLLALGGLGVAMQYSLTGIIAVAGTLFVRHIRKSQHRAPDMNLDVGQPVKVVVWHADGTARVQYRGAEWDAEPESPGLPREGVLYIKAIQGSRLIITQHRPQ